MTDNTHLIADRKDWHKALAGGIWSSLVILVAVLLSRKWAGALTGQIPAWIACGLATLAMLFALAAHCLHQAACRGSHDKSKQILAGVITLVPPMALGLILLPEFSAWSVFYLATLFLLASLALLCSSELPGVLTVSTSQKRPVQEVVESQSLEKVPQEKTGSVEESEISQAPLSIGDDLSASELQPINLTEATDLDPSVSQWMQRKTDREGRESIEGAVQIEFAPGQKLATVHLPFCPALPTSPELECEVLDDYPVRLKVAAVHSYGARIEARRSARDSDPAWTVLVGFEVDSNALQKEAA